MQSKQSSLPRVVIILLLAWFLLLIKLGDPFINWRDASQVWIPASVRNFSEYDRVDLGWMVTKTSYPVESVEQLNPYSHHPPLVVWLPYVVTQFAGFNEVAIRFIFKATMLIAIAVFYTLARRLFDKTVAFWATLLFALTPMNSFFHAGLAHEPIATMSLLLYATIFINWLRQPTGARYIGLICTAILSVFSAWSAVIFVGVIGIYGMLVGNWKHRIGVIGLGFVSITSIMVMLLLYELWAPNSIERLINVFFYRSSASISGSETETITVIGWLLNFFHHMFFYATAALFLMGFGGFALMKRYSNRMTRGFTIALLIAGLLYLLVFRNAGYNHIYYKAFTLPALCITSAFVIIYSRQGKRRFLRPLVDSLLVVFVIQIGIVFTTGFSTPHENSVLKLIDYLQDSSIQTDNLYVTFPDSIYGTNVSLEYYSRKQIDWNIPLEDITIEDDAVYIFCHESQQYMNENVTEPSEVEIIDEICYVYRFSS
ncbi:MAG: glycosyltransferase family 39 protein [Chloroflexota bacterium]